MNDIVIDKRVHRDLFAALAMQGMLAHSTRYKSHTQAPRTWHDALADEAYSIADAMLKARAK